MRHITAGLLAIGLVGCATNSGIVPMGPDTYMVSRQAATGFSGTGAFKAECYREANEFCLKSGKQLRVTAAHESQPPYLMGNFPRAEIEFMCLSPGDPELTRPKSQVMPTSVIEIRNR